MENSSKALIIAGSILIAILLISVGVIIMNSTGNTQQTVEDMASSTEARSFNSQLTPFEGPNQSAAQVRSLYSTAQALQNSTGRTITWTGKTTSQLESNGKYTVRFTYGTDATTGKSTGYITGINIS